MGLSLNLIANIGQQINPIYFAILRYLHARCRSNGAVNIIVMDRRVHAGARINLRWPLRHKGHMGATFKMIELPAAVRLVDVG